MDEATDRESAPNGYDPDDMRKELIEYYKWVVNLAIFVITISASVASLSPRQLRSQWTFFLGWALLGACIVLNWFVVKLLVTLPLVASTPREDWSLRHYLWWESADDRLKVFGCCQNTAFLLGAASVLLGFLLNMSRTPASP